MIEDYDIPSLYHYTTADNKIDLSFSYEQNFGCYVEGFFCSTRGKEHSWDTWRNNHDDNPFDQPDMEKVFRVHLKKSHGILVINSQEIANDIYDNYHSLIQKETINDRTMAIIQKYKGFYIPNGLSEPWDSFIDVCCIWDLSSIDRIEEVSKY